MWKWTTWSPGHIWSKWAAWFPCHIWPKWATWFPCHIWSKWAPWFPCHIWSKWTIWFPCNIWSKWTTWFPCHIWSKWTTCFPCHVWSKWGEHKTKFVSVEQRHLKIFNEQGNCDYYEYIPGESWVSDQWSKFPVTQHKRFKQVEIKPNSFSNNLWSVGTPDLDLFGSLVSHQVPVYMFWKLNPYNKGRDAFQTLSIQPRGYAFWPVPLIGRVLCKVLIDQTYFIWSDKLKSLHLPYHDPHSH